MYNRRFTEEASKALDQSVQAAKELGIDFLGGYSALVQKGMTSYEKTFIESIPEALSVTERICSSVNVGSTKTGINMDAVALMNGMADIEKYSVG